MNYQEKIKYAERAANQLIEGKSFDSIKLELKQEGLYSNDIQNIIISARNIISKKFSPLIKEKLNTDENLNSIENWDLLSEDLKSYLIEKEQIKTQRKKLIQSIEEIELPDNWNKTYKLTRLFAAAGFVLSTVAIKERLLHPYETIFIKSIVVSMAISSFVYWIYIRNIKKWIKENYTSGISPLFYELIGCFQILSILTFFFLICYESSYWGPLRIASILLIIYGVYMYKLSKIRKDLKVDLGY